MRSHTGPGTGFLVSNTDSGAPVIQMLGTTGHRISAAAAGFAFYAFGRKNKAIDVFTWSPRYARLGTEPDQQFTIASALDVLSHQRDVCCKRKRLPTRRSEGVIRETF